jgi:2,3-diketo-5-methylthio-1-phosphopentane phosphatase
MGFNKVDLSAVTPRQVGDADVDEPMHKVLVSDFDGTMTRRDFYQLVVERLLPPGTPDYWGEYRAGRLTHFDALNAYFAAAVPGEATLHETARDMGLDPHLREGVQLLSSSGWAIVVASAGCGWYISRLLREAGVALEVHANPGMVVGGRLMMELPRSSPVFSPTTGIDKPGVVRLAQATHDVVAFAGDGPPDLEPALLVRPELRFATGHLAGELERLGEGFHRFKEWSEVARMLVGGGIA